MVGLRPFASPQVAPATTLLLLIFMNPLCCLGASQSGTSGVELGGELEGGQDGGAAVASASGGVTVSQRPPLKFTADLVVEVMEAIGLPPNKVESVSAALLAALCATGPQPSVDMDLDLEQLHAALSSGGVGARDEILIRHRLAQGNSRGNLNAAAAAVGATATATASGSASALVDSATASANSHWSGAPAGASHSASGHQAASGYWGSGSPSHAAGSSCMTVPLAVPLPSMHSDYNQRQPPMGPGAPTASGIDGASLPHRQLSPHWQAQPALFLGPRAAARDGAAAVPGQDITRHQTILATHTGGGTSAVPVPVPAGSQQTTCCSRMSRRRGPTVASKPLRLMGPGRLRA